MFTDPADRFRRADRVAGREQGVDYVAARYDYAGIAAGWAREDTTGFVKVLADRRIGLLLGAHVIGPEAATVIQP